MTLDNKNRDELLMAYLLNELNTQDANKVSQWIAMSDDNLKQFENITKIWNVSSTKTTPHFNPNNAWSKVNPQLNTTPFYKTNWFRAAAAIIILFGTINWLLNTSSNTISTTIFSQNEILNDTLIDGSVVTLNTNSNLSYANNFDGSTREVSLKGEAFFDIERDPSKPFIIHLNKSTVTVLGTSFNIQSKPESELVSVYVKSGVVLFEYLSNTKDSTYLSVELHAGDKVVYNKSTHQLEPLNNSNSAHLDMYWMNKELVFDGIELGKVAQVLKAVYDVNITFTHPQTKNCLLTANFKNAQINEIIEVIAFTFELDFNHQNNTYQLIGKSCEEL